MAAEGSVSNWIDQLKAGDRAATQQLWGRYFQRLVSLARAKLQGAPRRAADEEDVALSAFHSFCRAAELGRFPRLLDRDSLWRLLVVLTSRKASHLVRHERRQKRRAPGNDPAANPDDPELEAILGSEPTPEFAAELAEECQRLLDGLGSAELAQIALWKMEGYANEEIAAKLDCVPRTVERKLRLIRSLWADEVAP
ncbi:MAG TPA: ECF-type sigma factor [Gemmataceae bacterium]|nr:ECF-type sigma factor [Gemmataceae bacterium]